MKIKLNYSEYGIIFDMDGVLADTAEIHYESWIKLAKDINIEFKREFFKETFGQQSSFILRKLLSNNISDEKINELADKKEFYYRNLVKDKLKPLPGTVKLIKKLRKKGFKLAIGSSGCLENINLLINTLKINNFFEAIVSAEDVKNSKPAPDVFLKAAEKLKIVPKNCVVIEDAPVGIRAAKLAGMRSIALTTTHTADKLQEADIIKKNLSSLKIKHILNLLIH